MNKSLSELPVSVCHPFGRLRAASEAKPKNPGFVSQLAAQMLHGVYPERSRRVQHDSLAMSFTGCEPVPQSDTDFLFDLRPGKRIMVLYRRLCYMKGRAWTFTDELVPAERAAAGGDSH
jgi:hypothetical protein